MAIDMERFRGRYGKIRYLESIECRHPVRAVCQNDINRGLMIKFKYGNLTLAEEREFHEAIKKIIYRVMHKNNVMMDWEDVYQEIWKKIVKSKHTWKEWKGTMVSTWITIVANSVINTLRQNVNKYNSRVCLYDDIVSSMQGDGDENSQNLQDSLAYSLDDDRLDDDCMRKIIWKEQYEDFRKRLDMAESVVFDTIMSMQDEISIDGSTGTLKMPYHEIREKSGYDESTFSAIISNIKMKYREAFGVEVKDSTPPESDNSDLEFLF